MTERPEVNGKLSGVENVPFVGEHIEEGHDHEGKKVRHRGVYLLPNLFTTANLFIGFYSIVCAINHEFATASAAIFIAMVMDGFDGRVARMTNTQSAFGAEYDSLADMVAFGLAPALLAHQWVLNTIGNIGLSIAFIYAACAALRLARFNTQIGKVDKRWFIGLASPAAAGVVAGCVWAITVFDAKHGFAGEQIPFLVTVLFAGLVAASGLLMVSNLKYYSFKDFNFKERVPFVVVLIAVLAIAIVSTDTPRVLFFVFFFYALSGPAYLIMRMRRRRKLGEKKL